VSPTRRLVLLVLAVGALTTAAIVLPLRSLPDTVANLGPAAPVVAVAAAAVLLVALVPRTPISFACGLLFGAGAGTVCALAAALTAAAVTFAAGRWLGRGFVVRHAGRTWNRLEGWIAREGVLAVAAVRALPLGPYGLVGYVYGASGVRIRDFAFGTLVAGIPSSVTYALLGAAVARPGDLDGLALLPLAFGLALSAAVLLRARFNRVPSSQVTTGASTTGKRADHDERYGTTSRHY
jgi:uncharacterized membrane protein YdjX (TVP38/TMEM64 family)